ncbi:pectin lyase fold/virulence factor [Plectosphaerella cucumerina]|uniref:Pectinesterase n=1 Tax=Plectosphaerella cucumerina TaxID=40658 RepID=A0A8K0TNI5_9PEZI|nr:pectin lyase fold/virulence factor [Plectosphaerella cucumerina]
MVSRRLAHTLLALATSGLCLGQTCCGKNSRTRPPTGALLVDQEGEAPGSFSTLGAAVANLHNRTEEQTIFILPGTYTEQVYVPPHAGPIIFQGYTCDTHSYADNQVTITGNISRSSPNITNNDQTSTIRLWSANVKMYNLNIANTFGRANTNGQALAMSAQNTNQGFYGCQFTGYQDTIYANEGRQVYAHSFINGAVDFIFGLRAAAWFESCDIQTIGPGYITANGREADENKSIYVFNNAQVSGTSGQASTVLGRPWRQFSRVVFQDSWLGDVVKPEGWSAWDQVQPVINVVYREFQNTGPGSVGPRVSFAGQLKSRVALEDVLGKGYEDEWWVDTDFL